MTDRIDANEWWMGLSRETRKIIGERVRNAAGVELKVGDRVCRTMCGGSTGTFTFTHWEGHWACGKTVSDCSPLSIFKVNGKNVNFLVDEYKYAKGLQA